MTQPPQYPPPSPQQWMPPSCYVHPGSPAGAVCRRCQRPICPQCMVQAPVGWQCAPCVHEDSKRSPVTRWRPSSAGTGRLGRTRITPVVIALIVVNVIAFIYEESVHFGAALNNYLLVPFLVHQHPLSIITSAFLHENVEHIALNMITLAIVGPAVEAELGRARFLLLYLLAALGGSAGFYLLAPAQEAGLGASGAIFGLMSAYFVLARVRKWEIQTISVLLVVNVLYSFSGGIAWQDHLGGLVTGALACFGMVWAPRGHPRPTEMTVTVQAVAVGVTTLVILALLFQVPYGQVSS